MKDTDRKPVGQTTGRQPRRKQSTMQEIATGEILANRKVRRWYPVALWIAILMFIYIGIHFYYQNRQRAEIRKRIELNEERSRAVIFSSIRMDLSRRSKIVDEVRRRGIPLEEPQSPPKVIEKHTGDR